ncbi:transketolase-like TK C-terminal-containing protein [Burkholderia stabilis]|uniref:Pyruvate dehydrogenase E1 component,2-oxoacid dehydrogenase subunit E1,Pyruvate dehydrogenase complex, dehydrogenase (E1) component,pyruvate dehydrogenase (Acetyl-transferring), homodimeric type n=1 Tax=Burkholderia stabilis TaxID=95485 RepID=A0AAJ5N9S9_9BURK|nr:pyruvate dehydrogenase [Burkholderia stabilis]VBB14411.1 Pyruvate dehydrogenase E1 component,2-oxoacid dehydrogenase subunit E1,Pyruvate dehydrogenase complex, dehydrogenase (E1) component,pyruvate dehydrogenase (acetyl-transferring), homodimeric type [Burkholderia stabilis]
MQTARSGPPVRTLDTRRAAAACLERLVTRRLAPRGRAVSPLGAMRAAADCLEHDAATSERVWVVRADDPASAAGDNAHRRISAWPLRFLAAGQRFERPLLYLLQARATNRLRLASAETVARGIFVNDAETTLSSWPKGVTPDVPHWLAANPACTPYDPASGHEAIAILRHALHALYVDGQPGFFYLASHDDCMPDTKPLSATAARDAFRGMVRAGRRSAASAVAQIRLCGAGSTLAHVMEAADLLHDEWRVDSTIWSCPSYTQLARDGREADRWNLLHPHAEPRIAHVRACLGEGNAPVLAVTGYARHVAAQIGAFVPARFAALGADSAGAGGAHAPNPRWIVAVALRLLADAGRIPADRAAQAIHRYGLA